MSADKRSVSTDALATLGTIIESGDRDAIHLAVMPIVASEALRPAQHIGIKDGKATAHAEKMLGIVDPFLIKNVEEGQQFWLIVYPRQITSLRHVWSHPDFPEGIVDLKKSRSAVEKAIDWIEAYADDHGVSYSRIMAAAETATGTGWPDYIIGGGEMEGESVSDEFWDKWEIVTGRRPERRQNFFSCSC